MNSSSSKTPLSLSTQLQLREGLDRYVKDIFGLAQFINTSTLAHQSGSQQPTNPSAATNPKGGGGTTAAVVANIGFPLPMNTLWTLAKAVKTQAKDIKNNNNR